MKSGLASWEYEVPSLSRGLHLRVLREIDELRKDVNIYPESKNVFRSLECTSFDDVKIVILGQDPYYKPKQANGLAFSVPIDIKSPPTLKNILKEVNRDIYDSINISVSTELDRWAKQGVLLLNTILTVESMKPGSHKSKGWAEITDNIISTVSNKRNRIVFLLWGNFAKSKISLIDQKKHMVLCSPHPSPLSAYRGFFDSGHFSKANKYLENNKIENIIW